MIPSYTVVSTITQLRSDHLMALVLLATARLSCIDACSFSVGMVVLSPTRKRSLHKRLLRTTGAVILARLVLLEKEGLPASARPIHHRRGRRSRQQSHRQRLPAGACPNRPRHLCFRNDGRSTTLASPAVAHIDDRVQPSPQEVCLPRLSPLLRSHRPLRCQHGLSARHSKKPKKVASFRDVKPAKAGSRKRCLNRKIDCPSMAWSRLGSLADSGHDVLGFRQGTSGMSISSGSYRRCAFGLALASTVRTDLSGQENTLVLVIRDHSRLLVASAHSSAMQFRRFAWKATSRRDRSATMTSTQFLVGPR